MAVSEHTHVAVSAGEMMGKLPRQPAFLPPQMAIRQGCRMRQAGDLRSPSHVTQALPRSRPYFARDWFQDPPDIFDEDLVSGGVGMNTIR